MTDTRFSPPFELNSIPTPEQQEKCKSRALQYFQNIIDELNKILNKQEFYFKNPVNTNKNILLAIKDHAQTIIDFLSKHKEVLNEIPTSNIINELYRLFSEKFEEIYINIKNINYILNAITLDKTEISANSSRTRSSSSSSYNTISSLFIKPENPEPPLDSILKKLTVHIGGIDALIKDIYTEKNGKNIDYIKENLDYIKESHSKASYSLSPFKPSYHPTHEKLKSQKQKISFIFQPGRKIILDSLKRFIPRTTEKSPIQNPEFITIFKHYMTWLDKPTTKQAEAFKNSVEQFLKGQNPSISEEENHPEKLESPRQQNKEESSTSQMAEIHTLNYASSIREDGEPSQEWETQNAKMKYLISEFLIIPLRYADWTLLKKPYRAFRKNNSHENDSIIDIWYATVDLLQQSAFLFTRNIKEEKQATDEIIRRLDEIKPSHWELSAATLLSNQLPQKKSNLSKNDIPDENQKNSFMLLPIKSTIYHLYTIITSILYRNIIKKDLLGYEILDGDILNCGKNHFIQIDADTDKKKSTKILQEIEFYLLSLAYSNANEENGSKNLFIFLEKKMFELYNLNNRKLNSLICYFESFFPTILNKIRETDETAKNISSNHMFIAYDLDERSAERKIIQNCLTLIEKSLKDYIDQQQKTTDLISRKIAEKIFSKILTLKISIQDQNFKEIIGEINKIFTKETQMENLSLDNRAKSTKTNLNSERVNFDKKLKLIINKIRDYYSAIETGQPIDFSLSKSRSNSESKTGSVNSLFETTAASTPNVESTTPGLATPNMS